MSHRRENVSRFHGERRIDRNDRRIVPFTVDLDDGQIDRLIPHDGLSFPKRHGPCVEQLDRHIGTGRDVRIGQGIVKLSIRSDDDSRSDAGPFRAVSDRHADDRFRRGVKVPKGGNGEKKKEKENKQSHRFPFLSFQLLAASF